MSLTTNSPHQSTESPSASPDISISSSSAVLPPPETFILSRIRFNHPLSPAAAVSRLETWSDSASEETYICYSSARDSDGPQILLTRPPGNYQMLSSRICAKIPSRVPHDIPPVGSMPKTLSGVSLDLHHPQQYLGPRLGQIMHRRNQEYLSLQGLHPLRPQAEVRNPQAEHPHLLQDGYVLKYYNIYHLYISHKDIICAYAIYTHCHASFLA